MIAEMDISDPFLVLQLSGGELVPKISRPSHRKHKPRKIAPKPVFPTVPRKDEIDCANKQRYDKRGVISAVKVAAENGRTGLRAYACPYCRGWHLSKISGEYKH